MCSFTVLGGSENQSVSGVITICLTQRTYLLRIELIRLLIVACGMLVHSSSMAVWSCWYLPGTGTHCRIRRSRVSLTRSLSEMSGEYVAMQELECFQLPEIVHRSLQHEAVHYHAATWGDGRGWMAQQYLWISSRYLCAFKMPSIKCTCVHCP